MSQLIQKKQKKIKHETIDMIIILPGEDDSLIYEDEETEDEDEDD